MRYADYWCVPGCRNQVTPVVWRTAVHKSDSHATLCWREGDSNHWSLPNRGRFSEQHPLDPPGRKQTYPDGRGTHALPKTKFAADSALEGAGFEPSVPRLRRSSVRCRPQLCSLRRLKPTPVSSLPRSQADMLSATTLKSKNPVEFRPWSYEFDGNRNARAMW
jgi:hypothetical protein